MVTRFIDRDLILTALIFYLMIPVILYGILSITTRIILYLIPISLMILVLVYISVRSYCRFLIFDVSRHSIDMKMGSLLFIRKISVDPDEVKAIYEIDPCRRLFLRAKDTRLPIFFLFKDRRKWIRIKYPPRGLADSISTICGLDLKRSSFTHFIHDHLDDGSEVG